MIPQWHILGAGAIGRLFACKLSRMGLEPVLVVRRGPAGHVEQLLRREQAETQFRLATIGATALGSAAIEGLLVTTKANDAVTAVDSVAGALAPGAPVILLHNGMGVHEQLSESRPDLNLLAGTTTEGAYLEGSLLVHAGIGATVIGQQGEPQPDWFAGFADSDEHFSWTSDIDAALWKKLLVNCAINPLTAIHRCPNGQLLEDPALRRALEEVCAELAAVSAARGNDAAASHVSDWVAQVIRQTAPNQSSMLQDVMNRRATEIDYITGFLLREAQRLGVPCPHNESLLRQLDSVTLSN